MKSVKLFENLNLVKSLHKRVDCRKNLHNSQVLYARGETHEFLSCSIAKEYKVMDGN